MKFSRLVARFLKWAKQCLSKSSVNVYYHYFRRFIQHHGDKPIISLRPTHLSEWAKTWHEAQAIKRLFKWAVEEAGLVKTNPFAFVTLPPKGQRRRTMKRREQLGLLRECPADLRALLVAHRETFARPQELRNATVADLQWEDESMSRTQALRAGLACIVLHEFKQRKKRRIPGLPRVILLSPRVGRLIERLLKTGRKDEEPIFQTSRKQRWTPNAVRCRFRRMRRRLGLVRDRHGENIVPYTFRHSGATAASAKGIRDRLLADILGHVEVSTTWRYQHLCTDDLRSALQPLWNVTGRRRVQPGESPSDRRPSPN
jgi:integrase